MGEGWMIATASRPTLVRVARRAALVLVAAAPKAVAADARPPAAAVVARAATTCFSTLVRSTGYLVPRQTAVVMFNAPGFRLTEVLVKEGDEVSAGQQVALATQREGQPPPSGAQAQPGAAGPAQGPASLPIKAPIAGIVLGSTAKVGLNTSATADPLFTIAAADEIEMMADIPSLHVAELNPGQTARIALDDGREFAARVRLAPSEINGATQLGQARISIDGRQALKAGTFARVAIDAQRSCGVAVPRSAVIHRSEGLSVQIVRNGIVATRHVRLGLLSDSDAEIEEGVAEGDLVVANAGGSLRDGDRVRPLSTDLQEVR